jgi:hypothetical protein
MVQGEIFDIRGGRKASSRCRIRHRSTDQNLVIAAAEQEKRKTMSSAQWNKMVKEMVAPKKK